MARRKVASRQRFSLQCAQAESIVPLMQHRCKELDEMLAKLASLGFRLEYRKNGVTIYPTNKSVSPYTAHYSERALHPVRRWVKNVCQITLN